MAQVFFIPADPEAFFRTNLLEGYGPPEAGSAWVFPSACLSCGTPTEEVTVFRGAYVAGDGRQRRGSEQTLPLCAECTALRRRRAVRHRRANIAAALLLTGVSALGVGVLTQLGWLGDLGGVLVLGAALITSLVFVRGPFAASLLALVPRSGRVAARRYQHVELVFFTDPRKGEGAEFWRLLISNEELAAGFAARNPHAVSADAWARSYER